MVYPLTLMDGNRVRCRLGAAALSCWLACAPVWGAPAAPGAVKPVSVEDPSAELFTNDAVRHLRIEIGNAEMERLRQHRHNPRSNQENRPEVPVTVREGERVFTNVSLHLKGAVGSFRPIDSRPAMTLNFESAGPVARFHGLKKFSLNNSVQDPTFVSEKLCRELFVRAGVPTPRSDYATVELNGRSLGLYVLVEGWNRQFLGRHFRNTRGNCYDGGFLQDINQRLRVGSGEFPEDQTALRDLAQLTRSSGASNLYDRLSEKLDLDRFVALEAVDMLIWNWDGYPMHANNYRVFHDLDSGRLVFMPHGLDQTFQKSDGPILTGDGGLAARALLSTRQGRQRCLERIAELRASLFQTEALTNRVDELTRRLQPALARVGSMAAGRQRREAASYKQRIVRRMESIDRQLAELKDFAPLEPGQSLALANWQSRGLSGAPAFARSASPEALRVILMAPGAGVWSSRVWLEQGRYAFSGRVRTEAVETPPGQSRAGAALRAWSPRKTSPGPNWDWAPHRQSRDGRARGDLGAEGSAARPLTGRNGWSEFRLEFVVRQPLADVELRCELDASLGAAWFDPASLQVSRLRSAAPAN